MRAEQEPVADDTNSLPPGTGKSPLFRVRDYAHKMPEDMARKGGVFFPMYQREAMWIDFSAGVRINPRCANPARGVGSPWLFRLAVATPEIAETDDADEAEAEEMGLAAGGLIKQATEADTYPADVWDVEASAMLNLQTLDVGSFGAVTGLPALVRPEGVPLLRGLGRGERAGAGGAAGPRGLSQGGA
ncbi:hypothetical protein LX32DRAFT_650410 [Colletotrichum zoysiae]|uniref:Uncharacterized protein n=1 Tax=Colletotrichum zoysiae TaxID=1216348 RepID=A0AAD9HMG8_9PEZI|nr:hypothetical protein LX32DRAFT_650410 [Colletotrichum zoysiae]